jgi:hypothetical protein
MFSAKVIAAKKRALQDGDVVRNIPPLDFTLTEYDVKTSLAGCAHLKSLVSPTGPVRYGRMYYRGKQITVNLIRPLTVEERQFIRNERLMCSISFLYCALRYLWIVSNLNADDESEMLFTPSFGQKILLSMCAWAEERGLYILLQILKARQLGASTFTELVIAWKIVFHFNVNALVGSSDPDKTKKMAGKMVYAWEHMPWYLLPEDLVITKSREQFVEVVSQNNYVTLQHGTQMAAIARGDTITDFHLSEIPDFSNPKEDIDAGLMHTIHHDSRTFGVMESTAKGKTGYWPASWKVNIRAWSRKRYLFRPAFLAWFLGVDLYPTPNWLKANPIPRNWKPKAETVAHVRKCERYAARDPLYVEHLGEGWKMPRAMQWWYEVMQEAAEEDQDPGAIAKWMEEMPATPDEAWQSSGWSIFKPAFIESLRRAAADLADYHGRPAIFRLSCPPIDQEVPLIRSEIDTSRPPITITVDTQWGRHIRVYKLLPMLPHNLGLTDGLGYVYVYKWPDGDTRYTGQTGSGGIQHGLGLDAGYGVRQDRTVAQVVRKGSPLTPYEQVCEFADDRVDANLGLYYADALGYFYSTVSDDCRVFCKQVIEIAAGGYDLQKNLRQLGWPDGAFHEWKGKYDSLKWHKATGNAKLGWETNSYTRPMLVTAGRAGVLSGHLKVNSPFCIDEIQTLRKLEDSDRIEADSTSYDDRCFALFFPYFSMSDHEETHALAMTGAFMSRQPDSGLPTFIPEPSDTDGWYELPTLDAAIARSW